MNTDGRRYSEIDPARLADEAEINALTQKVIGCAFIVANKLGCGHFENVYENAMCIELRKAGLKVEQQPAIDVLYDGLIVGEYFADLIVEKTVLVELKSVRALDDLNTAQCLNYLLVTGLPICLLINFGKPKTEIKRFAGQKRART